MPKRLRLFDAIRGFSVISMVAFHYCYDLKFIVGMDLPWFAPPLQDIWRASISWAFISLAGCMCALSRSNLRRGLLYGGVALAIFVITSAVAVDVPISFGVIYCMAACTLVEWLLERMGVVPHGPKASCVLFALFVLCLEIPHGWLGIGPIGLALPRALYGTAWLSWLGFPGAGFASGDYYPLLPYLLLFLAGSSLGWWWKERGYPKVCYTRGCTPLEFVGRHALPIYAAHQPILLLLSGALL